MILELHSQNYILSIYFWCVLHHCEIMTHLFIHFHFLFDCASSWNLKSQTFFNTPKTMQQVSCLQYTKIDPVVDFQPIAEDLVSNASPSSKRLMTFPEIDMQAVSSCPPFLVAHQKVHSHSTLSKVDVGHLLPSDVPETQNETRITLLLAASHQPENLNENQRSKASVTVDSDFLAESTESTADRRFSSSSQGLNQRPSLTRKASHQELSRAGRGGGAWEQGGEERGGFESVARQQAQSGSGAAGLTDPSRTKPTDARPAPEPAGLSLNDCAEDGVGEGVWPATGGTCLVCLDAAADAVLLECGHGGMCAGESAATPACLISSKPGLGERVH